MNKRVRSCLRYSPGSRTEASSSPGSRARSASTTSWRGRRRSRGQFAACSRRLSLTRPLLVFFDDLHWAEPTFLRLIQYLGEHARDAPMLVVCSSRPDLSEKFPPLFELPGAPRSRSSRCRSRRPARSSRTCSETTSRREIVARVEEVAEGNPLFIEETVRMLLDEGLIVRHGSRWEPVRDLSGGRTAALDRGAARRAPRPARAGRAAVLQRASVIGRIFGWGAVRELLARARHATTLADALQGLLRKEVVFTDAQLLSGEDAYRFGHILVRDAAYRGVPKETRAELHERFATFLADSTGDRVAEYEEIIGYHLEQAFGFRMELGPLNEVAADVRTRGRSRLDSAGAAGALSRRPAGGAQPLPARCGARRGRCQPRRAADPRRRRPACSSGSSPRRRRCSSWRGTSPARRGDERWAAHAELGLEFVLLQTDPARADERDRRR